jgi:hypothetical protein
MINSKVDHCKTLEEFYSEIRRQQEEAHGDNYCAQHDALTKYMRECKTYRELGTHQGGTAAAAMLCNPKSVDLVDISMEKFNKSKHLFEAYANENNIKLSVHEISSVDKKSTGICDLLLIDSYHHPNHLWNELQLHSKYVRKYIILHDTEVLHGVQNIALFKAAETFCNNINPWIIKERNRSNVGYTVLENTVK